MVCHCETQNTSNLLNNLLIHHCKLNTKVTAAYMNSKAVSKTSWSVLKCLEVNRPLQKWLPFRKKRQEVERVDGGCCLFCS